MHLDEYLPVLQKTNCRLDDAAAEAVLAHGWSAHVPGCPGWRLSDLVRHVAEVQHFWAWVVRTRATDPSTYVEPRQHPDDELLGWLGAQILRRVALPSSGLYPLAILVWTVFAYGITALVHASGFAAVYACALVLGNLQLPHRAATRSFVEGIGWIAQIGLFVMLGLLAFPDRVTPQAALIAVSTLCQSCWPRFRWPKESHVRNSFSMSCWSLSSSSPASRVRRCRWPPACWGW